MLKKTFKITFLIFLFLIVYTIPNIKIDPANTLPTNVEISDISHLNNYKIYLLNKDNLLVGVDTFIPGNTTEKKVKKIISYLVKENSVKKNLIGYLPPNIKLNKVELNNELLEIDFSKEILNSAYDINLIKTGLVYSLLSIKEIKNISISIEGQYLKGFTNTMNKELGINSKYLLTNRRDILKVTVYYLDKSKNYYIPVTKYLNSKKEKIEVIIDELKYESDYRFISPIDQNIKLLDYREESNTMILNFNNSLLNNNDKTQEQIYKIISYSVFDNYDVSMVMLEVDNKALIQIKKNSI